VVVPNKGVVVEGNETLVVAGGSITVFSLVAVGVVPNKGSVLVVANGAVGVTNDGIVKVLSLVIGIIVDDVTTGVDSF
jgi:hypothetical protein